MWKTVFRITLAIWIFIWVLFLVRPYFKKGLYKEYFTLFASSLDEKRAYVTGKELYGFVRFCGDSIGAPSSYRIIGLEKEDPIEYVRAVYYLYPNIDKADPEFLLVYKRTGVSREGYHFFKALAQDKYILRKT